jgi:hypothetical protein
MRIYILVHPCQFKIYRMDFLSLKVIYPVHLFEYPTRSKKYATLLPTKSEEYVISEVDDYGSKASILLSYSCRLTSWERVLLAVCLLLNEQNSGS